MEVAEGLGWLRPHLDVVTATYGKLRAEMDPIPAFEQTLAHVLDEKDYDHIQSFFDGEHDAVYGLGAGERARTHLRDALEAAREARPAGEGKRRDPLGARDAVDVANREGTERAVIQRRSSTEGEITDIDRFYDEDPARRRSEEVAFGNRWSLASHALTWDVFWIVETGELVAYRCDNATSPALSETLHRVFSDGPPPAVEVLEVEPDLERVRAFLGDWESDQGERDSYASLRGRLGLRSP